MISSCALPVRSRRRWRLRRTLLIAKRDYLQIVRTKAYIVGLILLPLLFGGGFLLIPLANRGNARDLRIAVLDETGVSAAAVIQSAEESIADR